MATRIARRNVVRLSNTAELRPVRRGGAHTQFEAKPMTKVQQLAYVPVEKTPADEEWLFLNGGAVRFAEPRDDGPFAYDDADLQAWNCRDLRQYHGTVCRRAEPAWDLNHLSLVEAYEVVGRLWAREPSVDQFTLTQLLWYVNDMPRPWSCWSELLLPAGSKLVIAERGETPLFALYGYSANDLDDAHAIVREIRAR